MITKTSDRSQFIGGSEANMLYMKYNTKTFIKWWEKKLTELPERSFNNKAMSVGTILEHDVIDLYESIYQVKGIRDAQHIKGIARANTDYILGDKVSDVKVSTKAFEWFLSEKVPKAYKHQLTHYMYVLGSQQASIIAYQVNDDLLAYPFDQLRPDRLFEIPVPITNKEVQEHKQRIEFLEHCKEMNVFPKEG